MRSMQQALLCVNREEPCFFDCFAYRTGTPFNNPGRTSFPGASTPPTALSPGYPTQAVPKQDQYDMASRQCEQLHRDLMPLPPLQHCGKSSSPCLSSLPFETTAGNKPARSEAEHPGTQKAGHARRDRPGSTSTHPQPLPRVSAACRVPAPNRTNNRDSSASSLWMRRAISPASNYRDKSQDTQRTKNNKTIQRKLIAIWKRGKLTPQQKRHNQQSNQAHHTTAFPLRHWLTICSTRAMYAARSFPSLAGAYRSEE